MRRASNWALVGLLTLASCTGPPSAAPTTSSTFDSTTPSTVPTNTSSIATTTTVATTTTTNPYARPEWLGERLLRIRDDGLGEIQPTPPELEDRRFETIDFLPPPAGDEFHSTIDPIPDHVLARSTWSEECPVTLEELAYVTVSHQGFDQKFHTGELIVNAAYAADIVDVFRQLHAARFPIEQMQVTTMDELDALPTGDGNVTGAFVCRPTVLSDSWSQHAYGAAIDVNPFQNPYVKDGIVIPELASYYTDRNLDDPGMICDGDVVVDAFASIGWSWGGHYETIKDYMHFSDTDT